MTVAQVAFYLQLTKLTVYKYVRDGRLPAVKLNRSFRIMKEDVQQFLQERKVVPAGRARARSSAESSAESRVHARRAATQPDARAPAKHSDEIYVGPSRQERRRPREAVITSNPLDWVIRGLH
jgi:excisionase family DNA binding protein